MTHAANPRRKKKAGATQGEHQQRHQQPLLFSLLSIPLLSQILYISLCLFHRPLCLSACRVRIPVARSSASGFAPRLIINITANVIPSDSSISRDDPRTLRPFLYRTWPLDVCLYWYKSVGDNLRASLASPSQEQ